MSIDTTAVVVLAVLCLLALLIGITVGGSNGDKEE